MNKRAVRSIPLKYHATTDPNNELNKFLNSKDVGEIYDFKITHANVSGSPSTMLYTFLYELIEEVNTSEN